MLRSHFSGHPKGSSKSNIGFEEKEDEDILRKGPRSTCEMAQLRWQTKELRSKVSPIFGWPPALVSQVVRNVSSDGALARKEADWPTPLTLTFYDTAILKVFEATWDFDR